MSEESPEETGGSNAPASTPEKVAVYKKKSIKGIRGCFSTCWYVLKILLIPVLLYGGFSLQDSGFEKIREMRQLERIPHVDAMALIEGEVTVTGHAIPGGKMVPGKYTKKRSYYLYWTKEEYVEDDDGGSWVTRDAGTSSVPNFPMKDKTGKMIVSLESLKGRGRPSMRRDYRHTRGDWRFSEYRIDPRDRLFAFAKAEPWTGKLDDEPFLGVVLTNDTRRIRTSSINDTDKFQLVYVCVVKDVIAGSPAERAGLRKGDIIRQLDRLDGRLRFDHGGHYNNTSWFSSYLSKKKVGDKVKIRIVRGKHKGPLTPEVIDDPLMWAEQTISVELAKRGGQSELQPDADYQLNFGSEGSFTPILSETATATSVRSGQGTDGVMSSVGSLACFAFGIMLLCFKLRIHRLLVFLSLLSGLNVFVLVMMGMKMMGNDLKDGKERLERHSRSAAAAIERELGLDYGSFHWESSLKQLESQQDAQKRQRVLGIRQDYAAAVERSNAILGRFPERYLSRYWGVHRQPSILEERDPSLADFEIAPSPIPKWLTWIGGILALVGGVLGSIWGFKRVKTKRYIENIPTSLSTGLAYGPAEIKGKAVLYDGNDYYIEGPLSDARCCHVYYKVTETRGSGDDRTTVTIEEWTEQVPFECHDEEGAVRVVPDGAEVQARLAVHRSSGRRNYYEYHIAEGEELYILGSAVIEPTVGETLQMADGDNDGFPFLISDQNERETMLKVSRGGLMRMSFGFIGIVMTVLLLFAGTGSYSPSDFLVAALTAPAFLVFSTFVLMFNDLVFLRNRIKRAHANIEVSLKKRIDMIPNMESVAKQYLAHEREVHENIATLRSILSGKKKYTSEEIDSAIRVESAVTNRMLALAEDYPELKGNEVMGNLMETLIQVENEVALMRSGYNDSVELYRTGSQRFPEVILAKTFGFRNADFLRAELEVRKTPTTKLNV